MRTAISQLLQKEDIISEDSYNININEFYEKIKEIGLNNKVKSIKREEISKNLDTDFIGKNIYIYKEVLSTNTLAKFFAENSIENGTVIISETQTRARGRNGKPWQSPNGGVWLSIILNPFLEVSKAPLITLASGIAVAKMMEKMGIKNPMIKWPNDILINGKKASGILTESKAKLNSIEYIIVGVGIDVNLNRDDLPEGTNYKTTSLSLEKGEDIDKNQVIKIFLEEFEKICNLFIEKDYDKILNDWRKRSYTIGKTVQVYEPFGKTYKGYVVGINKEGYLIVERHDGSFEKVISGEVKIK